MYYVYILKSKSTNKHYIGITDDLRRRFEEHNNKKVRSTKNGAPWQLIYYEAHLTKTSARKTELFYKTSQGRRQIKKKLSIQ